MKTKYCNNLCKEMNYELHTAICIYKRRDAGEFDEIPKLRKIIKGLEKRITALEEKSGPHRYNSNGKAYC